MKVQGSKIFFISRCAFHHCIVEDKSIPKIDIDCSLQHISLYKTFCEEGFCMKCLENLGPKNWLFWFRASMSLQSKKNDTSNLNWSFLQTWFVESHIWVIQKNRFFSHKMPLKTAINVPYPCMAFQSKKNCRDRSQWCFLTQKTVLDL